MLSRSIGSRVQSSPAPRLRPNKQLAASGLALAFLGVLSCDQPEEVAESVASGEELVTPSLLCEFNLGYTGSPWTRRSTPTLLYPNAVALNLHDYEGFEEAPVATNCTQVEEQLMFISMSNHDPVSDERT